MPAPVTRQEPPRVDGVLVVDKPQDWTSHDVCAFIRKRFRIKKVGHAGTLDPLATGVLVVLLGKATKSSNDFSNCDKEYAGSFQLGIQTDSHDRTGTVTAEKDWRHIDLDAVRKAAGPFTGEIIQVPPMVSALKHKGVRLYKLARKGQTVEREGRPVHVHRFDIDTMEGPFVRFSTLVSKGTYVRTLVNDLGEALGCHATLNDLRRTRSGPSSLKNSVTIEDLKQLTLPQLRDRVFPVYSVLPYENSQTP